MVMKQIFMEKQERMVVKEEQDVDADEYFDVSQLTIDISGGDGGNGQDWGDGYAGLKGEDGNENDVFEKKFLK